MAGNPTDPTYGDAVAVGVGSDTVLYAPPLRALFIGATGSGALKVTTADGTTITFAGLTGGFLLPLNVSQVFATGTSVTGIVGLK